MVDLRLGVGVDQFLKFLSVLSIVVGLSNFEAADWNQAKGYPSKKGSGVIQEPESLTGEAVTPADAELVAQIQYAIREDAELFSTLHNVKIIAENGRVRIQGFVATETEEIRILECASSVAGYSEVISELSVAPLRGR